MHRPEKPTGSTYSSTRGLSPREQLEMQADFHSSTQDESWLSSPISVGTCDPSQKWRGNLMFLLYLKMMPFSISPNPVEFREATPNSTASLTSQRHPEKLPEVTGTSWGNPGFSTATRERPRECFKMSWVAIPLQWLERHDTLPLATRMETWLTWHCTRGSLRSSSYLVRKSTVVRQLEETHVVIVPFTKI